MFERAFENEQLYVSNVTICHYMSLYVLKLENLAVILLTKHLSILSIVDFQPIKVIYTFVPLLHTLENGSIVMCIISSVLVHSITFYYYP